MNYPDLKLYISLLQHLEFTCMTDFIMLQQLCPSFSDI